MQDDNRKPRFGFLILVSKFREFIFCKIFILRVLPFTVTNTQKGEEAISLSAFLLLKLCHVWFFLSVEFDCVQAYLKWVSGGKRADIHSKMPPHCPYLRGNYLVRKVYTKSDDGDVVTRASLQLLSQPGQQWIGIRNIILQFVGSIT